MLIRPVVHEDFDAILKVAHRAGIGMTSLPPDGEVLADKIERSVLSFAGKSKHEGDALFLFVLVDTDSGDVAGTCGIKAHIGLKQPFYSYKLSTITQASEQVGVFSRHEVLSVVNDYTGASELSSLYLLPEYRRDRLGRFLSRMRLVFIAQFPHLFDERVIAEIRGVNDRQGNSPFYDFVMKPFFQMDFAKADYLNATKGNQFIGDLLPKYPIYVSLLSEQARAVIGQPFPSSEAAKAMLEREGMRYNNYLDIFDGGPTLEARRDDIRTVKESRLAVVGAVRDLVIEEESPYYIFITTQLDGFRARLGRMELLKGVIEKSDHDVIVISPAAAKRLGVEVGSMLRYVRA